MDGQKYNPIEIKQAITAPICNAAIVGTWKCITPTKTRQTDFDFEKRIIFTIENLNK